MGHSKCCFVQHRLTLWFSNLLWKIIKSTCINTETAKQLLAPSTCTMYMILFVWNHFWGNLIFTWNFPDSASGFESCQHNSESFQDVRFVPRARKIILCLWLFNIFVCPGRAWKTAAIQPHLPFPRLPPARWPRFSQNQPQLSLIDWNCRCFTETFRTPCTPRSYSPRKELLLQPLPQRRRDSNPL